jgi:predicted permease
MDFPVQFNVGADWRVLGFGLAASILAGLLFGSAPAWRASRTDANAVLKGAQIGWGRTRLAFRDVLVVLQVTLCFVLVSGCLVSLRGLQQALAMNLGFRPQGVAVAAFELGLAGYSEAQGRSFQRRALDAVEQLPGVQSAAWSNSVPLSIDQSRSAVYPEDRPNPRAADATNAIFYQVSPRFLETMGIDLLAGRDFGWHDDRSSPPVAMVNLAFAKQVLHTESPLGKHFRFGPGGPLTEVIGMVEDGKYETLTESRRPVVFKPILQSYNTTTTLEVRSSLPEARMVGQIRQAMARLDPNLPIYGAGSLEQLLGFAFFPSRAAALVLSAFGLLAVMLAVTGIHGLVSYAVARRVREIGIRMAVGARPVQVLRLVLGRVMLLLAAGSAFGLVLAIAVGRVLASIVYQASPRDPLALAAVLAAIVLLGLLSSWAPARRALRIEPVIALRHD